jgi:anaphase-promoting complex subunit 5
MCFTVLFHYKKIISLTSNLQGICHLLTNTGIYYKEALSSCPSYETTGVEDSSFNLEAFLEYENMDLENFVFEKVTEEIEARKWASERVPFHLHAPKVLFRFVEGINTKPFSCEALADFIKH